MFNGGNQISSFMDMTGDRVDSWYKIASIASQIFSFTKLLKTSDGDFFKYQHNNNNNAIKNLLTKFFVWH